jgi:hypothetical protein
MLAVSGSGWWEKWDVMGWIGDGGDVDCGVGGGCCSCEALQDVALD